MSSCCTVLLSSHPAGWLLHRLLMHRPLVLLLRRPLILSAHQLIVVSSLVVLLLRHPLVLSSRQLVVALPLNGLPTCSLVAPPSHPLSAPADCRIASCRPLVAPSSRPLIAPAGCCNVSPCVTLSSSHCAGWLLSYLYGGKMAPSMDECSRPVRLTSLTEETQTSPLNIVSSP